MAKDEFVSVFSSENRAEIPVYPADVFIVTDAGTAQIRGGSTRLPPEALAMLVLLDGKATVGDLEARATHLDAGAVRNVLRSLLAARLIRAATIAETDGLDFSAFFESDAPAEPAPAAQASADRESAEGAPQLERSGYYVSIARQAVKPHAAQSAAGLQALVVEDDPDMRALVSRLLEGEGFVVAQAQDRDGILARLRAKPAPDLVILDVGLPDINGFDVLQRLKAHPALKTVPVIMLTADALRESVMRGLALGADGYITKPFERAALRDGVRAVIGLAP
ncbi:MAG TPA: response regulator [Burkholderiales bacterium]